MGMNIKNDEAHRLAQELSSLTGESLTVAVTKALRDRLAKVRKQQGGGVAQRLIEIGEECRPLVREPYRSVPHGDLLYDDKGLPK